MTLAGIHILNAPPARVWAILMEASSLEKIVPGVTSLEKLSEYSYKSTLNIKLGPVSASFTGNLQLTDIIDQKSFTLRAQQNSKIGNATATIDISLKPLETDRTEISFNGNALLSGVLASMGQRIIGGVSDKMTRQFFEDLEKQLQPEPIV